MTRYTVMLCCNDERGMPTGRVEQVDVTDEIKLEAPSLTHVFVYDAEEAAIGDFRFPIHGHQRGVGNVFWDAIVVDSLSLHLLVEYLVEVGWSVTEFSDGPFAKYGRKAGA